MHGFFIAVLMVSGFLIAPAAGRDTGPGTQVATPVQKPQTTIRATAEEVLVDLIVRDKKGRFLNDLKPDEVQIYEDEKKQTVRSFRLISGTEAISQGATTQKKLDPLRQVRLVSLVYERLGQDGRRLARKASLDLLKNEQAPNVYYSVMRIDNSLKILQPFTNDRKLVRQAVKLATGGAKSLKSDVNLAQLQKQAEVAAAQGTRPEEVTGGPGAQAAGEKIAAAEMARVVMQMVRYASSLGQQQMGSSSISALMALVKGQQSLPGRKTVLYFSEGLPLNDNVIHRFNSLVGSANQANVAFYAIDARGLMSRSFAQANANMLSTAASNSARTVLRRSGATTVGEMRTADTAMNSIRANTQENLNELAVKTGGFLIANTNDLRRPLKKVVEDVYSYYELTYQPTNTDYNGAFRRLEVKVSRPKVRVQSRSGYFAMPPELKQALFPYEVPLLKAISGDAPSSDIGYQTKWFHFQPAGGMMRCAFDVEVPFKNLTANKDRVTGRYKSGVSVVAIFKDQEGRVVRKFSRLVPVSIPADKLSAIEKGSFIYTNYFAVPPGNYEMETAVGDPEGGKVAVKRQEVRVPAHGGGVALSDLVLIRRVDAAKGGEADPFNPFLFDGGKIVPSLRPVDSSIPGAQVSLYFLVYPDPKIQDKLKLTIEFYAGRQRLGHLSPELPHPDQRGRIPYIASIAAAALPPGRYDARVVVTQGETKAENRTSFVVR